MNNEINQKNGFQLLSKYRTAIMGFAALWILFFHTWVPVIENSPYDIIYCLYYSERVIKRLGYCGVDIFILLSGYSLTFAKADCSLMKFYFRRIRRILPIVLIVAIVRGLVEHWSFTEFLGNVSGFNFYAKHIFSFLWFITAIITLYLFFPPYYKLFCKAKNKYLFTGIAILIWLLTTLLLRDHLRYDFFSFTNRIPVFLIGIHFGYHTRNKKQYEFKIHDYLIIFVTFIAGIVLAYFYNYKWLRIFIPQGNCFLPNFLIAISLPFLLAKALDVLNGRISIVGKIVVTVLSFFGTFSLELYCVQDWLMDAIPYLEYFEWPGLLINATSFLIITAISWVLSVIIKYLLELADAISKRKSVKTDVISK